jgi:N-acetylated-alpha-linked acidic dipeptidase
MDIRFGGEDRDGQYHSIYDDFYWFTHFSDTNFAYGRALAQTAGTAVMRLADADLVPFEFTNQAETFKTYLKELQKLLKTEQDDTKERNQELDEGVFNAVSDPLRPLQAPPRLDPPPAINFAPLENSLEALTHAAQHYDAALKKLNDSGISGFSLEQLLPLNVKIYQSERLLVSDKGLPGRPWFKHQIYAPGAYTGYAVKTMPAVRESLEQRQWAQAEAAAATVSELLNDEAVLVDQLAGEIERMVKEGPSKEKPSQIKHEPMEHDHH